MTSMSWKDTLLAVTGVAPDLRPEIERLIDVVDAVLAGKSQEALLRSVLGDAEPPELITRLDAIGRAHARGAASDSLVALWSTLRGLPDLLAELSRISRGAVPRLDGHWSIRAALNDIEKRPSMAHSHELRCPRCLSDQVARRDESVGDGSRLIELMCGRCGLFDSLLSDNPAVAEWCVTKATTSGS